MLNEKEIERNPKYENEDRQLEQMTFMTTNMYLASSSIGLNNPCVISSMGFID